MSRQRTSRFERRLEMARVTVIGAGRTGSFACLALAMAGIRSIRVYDHDRLDPARNLGVQFYRAADVRRRRLKVEALPRLIHEVCPDVAIEGIPERFPDGAVGPSGPIVLFGMDTMESRRRAAEALLQDRSLGLLVDVRIGGTVVRCHTVRGREGLDQYLSTLYGDDDSWGGTCADSPDPHVAMAGVSIGVAAVMAYLRGTEVRGLVLLDLGPWTTSIGDGLRPPTPSNLG
jgi:molybdopterin/thiamine biosynthesis adenylyltransferase